MELSVFTRIKVFFALAIGVILLGFGCWRFVAPSVAQAPMVFYGGIVSLTSLLPCIIAAFLAGFLSCFIAKPYGREIGILAVPAGLAAFTFRSGNMTDLLRSHSLLADRVAFYASMRWEGLLWLTVVLAGVCGTMLAAKISKAPSEVPAELDNKNTRKPLSVVAAVVTTVIIGYFLINIFVRGVAVFFGDGSMAVGQPATAQVAFGVFVVFLIIAFIVKLLLNVSYVWPAVSTVLVAFFAAMISGRADVLEAIMGNYAAGFFIDTNAAVLPIQFVCFGVLGSVAGYWWCLSYKYWRMNVQ